MADAKRICSVPGCGKRHASRGLCDTHYRRVLYAEQHPDMGARALVRVRPPPSTKVCTKCGEDKSLTAFTKAKSGLYGLRGECRACRHLYTNKWYEALPAERKLARFAARDPVQQAAYYQNHKDVLRAYSRAWVAANREKVRGRQRLTMRKRRQVPKLRLESNIGRAVNGALRGLKGRRRSFDLLGFTVQQLAAHLERQFSQGMSWDNYGKWHVDHIVPLASFSYSTATDPGFRAAWSLTNLRPLWAKENISKGARRLLLI